MNDPQDDPQDDLQDEQLVSPAGLIRSWPEFCIFLAFLIVNE